MNGCRRICLLSVTSAVSLVALSGCLGITNNTKSPPPPAMLSTTDKPTPDLLIRNSLNRNADLMRSLDVRDLEMDITGGGQSVGVSGTLYCQQPRNFHLRAKVLGNQVTSIGSNDQEFWYWIKENKPPDLYHCSYTDLARGGVRLPFPVQPEWVMEALGMAHYDASRGNFSVEMHGATFELVEQTVSLQNQPVKKVIVFNNRNANGNYPQIAAYKVFDANNKLICQATIDKVQREPNGAVVPHKVTLEWPMQQLKLKMTLDGVTVNNPETDPARNPGLFTRPRMSNIRTFDLARGTYDGPPMTIQPTSGVR
jgi:hypothetical protein